MGMFTKLDRYDAREQGLTRYYTGTPCKRGHDAQRFTANSACCQCVKERQQLRDSNVWYTFRFQASARWLALPRDEAYAAMQAAFTQFYNSKGFF